MPRFDFEIDISGARVVVARKPLCSRCLSDDEVDAQINILKHDLDKVAQQMKAAIAKQAEQLPFG